MVRNRLWDATHREFPKFVAVNEKGHAGEELRVAHDQQLYIDLGTNPGALGNRKPAPVTDGHTPGGKKRPGRAQQPRD